VILNNVAREYLTTEMCVTIKDSTSVTSHRRLDALQFDLPESPGYSETWSSTGLDLMTKIEFALCFASH
jgi:hypothetical protein